MANTCSMEKCMYDCGMMKIAEFRLIEPTGHLLRSLLSNPALQEWRLRELLLLRNDTVNMLYVTYFRIVFNFKNVKPDCAF
jgi:hypothetical protein